MNARQSLDNYLSSLRRRLQMAIALRTGAIVGLSILLITVSAIVWLTPLGFPKSGVIASRGVLALLLMAIAFMSWRWQRRLRANDGANEFERQLPAQQGRVQTYVELQKQASQGAPSPLIDLLAGDALSRTHDAPVEGVVKSPLLIAMAVIGGAAIATVFYLLIIGNAQWGYGSRHLLLGAALPIEAVPVKQVKLLPGDVTLRRNADLLVQANVQGFKAREVELFVRFENDEKSAETTADASSWERASMQAAQDGTPAKYALTLYALRAPLKYYVIADGVKSAEHSIKVVDVPHIDRMQLSFTYPQWTGLPPRKEDESRDIQAVADTSVSIAVQASEPLQDATLVIDDKNSTMTAQTNRGTGSLTVTKPAHYHIASRVAGDLVALTDDYAIEVMNDEPPTIEIVKPGRDWRASSIEEVPVIVNAKDDFRVQNTELRYAVNGGEWHTVKLPANAPQLQAKTQLSMEELGNKKPLAPGDLVTYYAVTQDRKQTVQTDLFMVQVQPFERRFTETQGGGGGVGGGGEGNEQQEIVERQKDLLIATWNLQRSRDQKNRTPQQIQDSGQMLAELQAKLAEQTKTLADRTRARARLDTDARLKQFVESLEQAADVMKPTAEQLSSLELPKAIPGEQQALQLLLRAESAFRDIQVARQQGAAGGGGSRSSRDISELYELEMDLNKNQYETEKQLGEQTASNQDFDAALAKLQELARRQEQLAQQRQQQAQPQTNAERWKQEQLRREAEELRRQLQQLAQQQQQQNNNGQSSSSDSDASSDSQASNSQSGNSQSSGAQNNQNSKEVKAALNAVENALQAMRNAANNDKGARQSAEQASHNLQQAAERMQRNNEQPANSGGDVEKLAQQARRLAEEQRRMEVELHKVMSESPQERRAGVRSDGLNRERAEALAQAKEQLIDKEQQLENDLRDATAAQRKTSPQTAKRLGEIAGELSNSNVASRLSRSMIDIQRGRADQIAIGEGIITQALENTATDLREATKLASREGEQKANAADPEALLAELGELRRALAAAQQANNGAVGQNQPSDRQANQSGANSPQKGQSQNSSGQNNSSQPGAAQSQSGGAQPGQDGGVRSGAQYGGYDGGSWRGGPLGPMPRGQLAGTYNRQLPVNPESLRIANAIRQQLSVIENRMNAGTITRDDIAALRALAPQIRRLKVDPNADAATEQAALSQTFDRLEMTVLNAAEKSRKHGAAHASGATSSSSQESETVAEYYRRLGK